MFKEKTETETRMATVYEKPTDTEGISDTQGVSGTQGIPGRAQRPDAELTIIYDGECRFCQKQIRRLQQWDKRGVIAYESLHDEQVYRDWPQLSKERLMEAMCLVDADGQVHWGPDVFRYLSRQLPEMWWLAPIMHIPFTRPLQRMVYRWIARRRYLWSGTDCEGSCNVNYR